MCLHTGSAVCQSAAADRSTTRMARFLLIREVVTLLMEEIFCRALFLLL